MPLHNHNPYTPPEDASHTLPQPKDDDRPKAGNLIVALLLGTIGLGFGFFSLFAMMHGAFLLALGCLTCGLGLVIAASRYARGDSERGFKAMYMSLLIVVCAIALLILLNV